MSDIERMVKWPDQFISGDVACGDSVPEKLSLIADALTAWGNTVLVGPIENFGIAMTKVGTCFGIVPTPENLIILSEQLLLKLQN